ncbi:hypothetical protein [Borrelia persica]|uniref:hypothetical protein n=1 Tax=Borrelia persica TaxID=44448 RepID=UPI0004B6F480|nr:hypothetical protein [Borrelia persica]
MDDMDGMTSPFSTLNKVLMQFKQELEKERVAFFSKEERLNINFKGVLTEIYYPSDLDDVYEALGYDLDIIRSLGRVFDILNFKHMGDRDTRIVTNLLNGLMHISHAIQTLFEDVLSKSKLEILQYKDDGDIEKIIQYLVRLIDAIKDLVLKLKDVIVVAASKTNEDDMLKELSRVVASSYSKLNKVMRNIHYLLFDIVEIVDLL